MPARTARTVASSWTWPKSVEQLLGLAPHLDQRVLRRRVHAGQPAGAQGLGVEPLHPGAALGSPEAGGVGVLVEHRVALAVQPLDLGQQVRARSARAEPRQRVGDRADRDRRQPDAGAEPLVPDPARAPRRRPGRPRSPCVGSSSWAASAISATTELMTTPPSSSQNRRSARARSATGSPRPASTSSATASTSADGIGGTCSSLVSVSRSASSQSPSTLLIHASCQRDSKPVRRVGDARVRRRPSSALRNHVLGLGPLGPVLVGAAEEVAGAQLGQDGAGVDRPVDGLDQRRAQRVLGAGLLQRCSAW